MAIPEEKLAVVKPQTTGMITPAGSIDDAVQQFKLYQQLKERLATEDDFQPIAGKKHPKKSFVRKVQRFFNISCELLRDEPLKDKDGKVIAWIATARAIHLPTGAYQDADGSCSFDEKVEKQRTIHNIRAHAITRAKNRAILDLVGFGEVSAEEINGAEYDTVHSQSQYTKTTNQGSRKASQKQVNYIQSLAREKGIDDTLLTGMLNKGFSASSVNELTSADASKVIKLLQERSLEQIKEFVGVEETEQVEAEMVKDVRDAVESVFEGEVVEVGDDEWPFD